MEGKESTLHLVRSVLVILAFILMLAVVVFQCFEIDKYGIADDMTSRLKGMFASSSSNDQQPADASANNGEESAEEAGEEGEAPATVNNDSSEEAKNDDSADKDK